MGDGLIGAIDVGRFVVEPFTAAARFDFDAFSAVVETSVRMLDDAIEQHVVTDPGGDDGGLAAERPVGLGVTGLADALTMLDVRYDSSAGREMAAAIARRLRDSAYAASADLARERGACPGFDAQTFLASDGAARLPQWLRRRIAEQGLRNLRLTALFPMERLSIAFADCASSGIDPPAVWLSSLSMPAVDGRVEVYGWENRAHRLYDALGHDVNRLPPAFQLAAQVGIGGAIRMAGVISPFMDAPFSRALKIPGAASADARREAAMAAWTAGIGMVSIDGWQGVQADDRMTEGSARLACS